MIQLFNIEKQYKIEQKPFYAIQDVNITILDRQMVFITGKSGSGKTTLLNILSGIDQPSSGKYYFNGTDIGQLSNQALTDFRNQYVSIVFQEYNLIESMTVKDNLLLVEWMNGKHSLEDIQSTLKSLGIEEQMNKYPYQLSGGQRQRVAIARAILKRPRILVADEPTGALDSETGKTIFDILKDLSKEMLVIVATHDLDSKKYADQVIEMIDGRIVSQVKQTDMDSNESVKLRKSQLKVRQAMMIGTKHFHQPWIKIVLMMLIMVTSMTLLGISQSATVFKEEQAIIESMDSLGVNTFRMTDTEMGFYQQGSYITNTDIESLSLAFPNLSFYKTFPIETFNLTIDFKFIYYDEQLTPLYYFPISQTFVDQNQFNLIGELPNAANEIVISHLFYEVFKSNDYQFHGTGIQIDHESDLIGKVLPIDHVNYTIVGILDTKSYKTFDMYLDGGISQRELIYLKDSLIDMVFISEDAFNSKISAKPLYFSSVTGLSAEQFYQIQYSRNGTALKTPLNQYVEAITSFEIDHAVYLFDGGQTLTNQQVIVPESLFQTWTNLIYDENLRYQPILDLIMDYAMNHFTIIEDDFKNQYGQSSNYESYGYYIYNHDVNEFEPNQSKAQFIHEDKKSFYQSYLDYFDENIYLTLNQKSISIPLEIVGISSEEAMILSIENYDLLINSHLSYHPYLIVQGDKESFVEFLKFNESNRYVIQNIDTYLLDQYQSIQQGIKTFSQGFSFGFGLIFILIAYLFLSQNIQHHLKDIGILKSIGLKNQSIIWIFLADSIWMITMVFSIYLLGVFHIIEMINTYIKQKYDLSYSYFNLSWQISGVILLITLLLLLLSILIPFIRLSRKSPIDIIRENKI